MLLQPEGLVSPQSPQVCLLEEGTGIQAAGVQGKVKGHNTLEIICRDKQCVEDPGIARGKAGDRSPWLGVIWGLQRSEEGKTYPAGSWKFRKHEGRW